MTLREEILKDAGLLEESRLVDTLNKLYQEALLKDGRDSDEFVGSPEYEKWVADKIKPLLKKGTAKKIFDRWENDLLFDMG